MYGEDEVTTGARSDLQRVRALARQMVAQWGFAAAALGGGPVAWETEEGNGLLAPRTASPAMEARTPHSHFVPSRRVREEMPAVEASKEESRAPSTPSRGRATL